MLDSLPITLNEDQGDYDGPFSTYKEWHSATIGAGLGFAVLYSMNMPPQYQAMTSAIALRTILYVLTGERVEIGGKSVELPENIVGQMREEPHYFLGGFVLGSILGFILY